MVAPKYHQRLCFSLIPPLLGHAFVPQVYRSTSPLVLHDRTTTNWFSVGDSVKVVEDVFTKNGANMKGKRGTVLEMWESCDVDPACCCSEQVEVDMAVRVKFEGGDSDFVYYFAEEELEKEP